MEEGRLAREERGLIEDFREHMEENIVNDYMI